MEFEMSVRGTRLQGRLYTRWRDQLKMWKKEEETGFKCWQKNYGKIQLHGKGSVTRQPKAGRTILR